MVVIPFPAGDTLVTPDYDADSDVCLELDTSMMIVN